jgi:hypothetical protein
MTMNRPSARAQLRGLLIYPLAALQAVLVYQPASVTEFLLYAFVSLIFGFAYVGLGMWVRHASGPGQAP